MIPLVGIDRRASLWPVHLMAASTVCNLDPINDVDDATTMGHATRYRKYITKMMTA